MRSRPPPALQAAPSKLPEGAAAQKLSFAPPFSFPAGASGQAVDIEIQAKEIMYHKGNLNRILAYHTGQPVEKARKPTTFSPPRKTPKSHLSCRQSPPLRAPRPRLTQSPTPAGG